MTDYTYAVLSSGNGVSNIISADNPDASVVLEMMLPDADSVVLVTEETGNAYIGSDFIDGRFRPPKPYSSWVWDADNFCWVTPVPFPEGGNGYIWDEASVSWIEIPPLEVESETSVEE